MDDPPLTSQDQLLSRVSVVITTYNHRNRVRQLLQSLERMDFPFRRLDVVVVDNDSTDGTAQDLAGEYGDRIRLLRNTENLGGSGGFRTGVHYVTTHLANEYIWILDDDVIVAPTCLTRLLASASQLQQSRRRWGAIGCLMAKMEEPELTIEAGARIQWHRGRVLPLQADLPVKHIRPELRPVEYCAAASLLTSKSAVEDVGFFEDVFIHYDDVDWCYRLQRKGYGVYCDTRAVIWHVSSREKPATWVRYYNVRNFLWLCRRHRPVYLPLLYCKFWRMYWYFRFHGLDSTAKLVASGIRDFRSGTMGKNRSLEFEAYRPIEELAAQNLSDTKIGIFKDLDEFSCLNDMLKDGFWHQATVLLYHPPGRRDDLNSWPGIRWILPRQQSLFGQLALCWKQWRLLQRSSRSVIIGDSFRNNIILPPFRRAYYVNGSIGGFFQAGKRHRGPGNSAGVGT